MRDYLKLLNDLKDGVLDESFIAKFSVTKERNILWKNATFM